jgi:hypothetical protein
VEVPPARHQRTNFDGGGIFELPDFLTREMGEDRLLSAYLSPDPSIVWDPRLLGYEFKIEFAEESGTRVPPDQISSAGDLTWRLDGTTARLTLKSNSLPITVQQINIFRNGFPKDSAYPMKTIAPGKHVELAAEPIGLRWWSRKIQLRAEVFIVSGSFGFKRIAEARYSWKKSTTRMELYNK